MDSRKVPTTIRRGPPRKGSRRALYAIFILVPIAVWFVLMEAYTAIAMTDAPLLDLEADNVVELSHTATLLEPRGTAGRDIANWLNARPDGSQSFEVGGDQFDGNTAELTAQSIARISRLAAMLRAVPDIRVGIVGYSSAGADFGRGLALSTSRAASVRVELVRFGVPAARISVEGRGSSDPVAPNDTSAGRRRNERVAIVLTRDPQLDL